MPLMAHVARSIVEGFRALGLPADAIARRSGVTLEGELPPFAVLPDSTYLALWREGFAADPSRNTLALEVGLALPFGAAGPLDYLSGSSATLGASLRVLQHAFKLAANDVRLDIDESRKDEVAVAIVNAPPFEGSHWSDELLVGLLISRGRNTAAAGDALPSSHVDLARPPPVNAHRWEALAGMPIRFGKRRSALYFPRSLMEKPLRTADQHLAATMRSLVGVPANQRRSLTPALRAHLRSCLDDPRQSAGAAARVLGVSLRTLQRQLMDQGLSFRAILDELRREQAELLLFDPSLSVFEVAQRLGFVEQASFTRAFRRWTGVTPRRWREMRSSK
jgi:AraC-like DNA-binding protein